MCFSPVLYVPFAVTIFSLSFHQSTCAKACMCKIRACAFIQDNFCIYGPAGHLVSRFQSTRYSLVTTLKDRNVLGGFHRNTFVYLKLIRTSHSEKFGVMTKIPAEMFGCRYCFFRHRKITISLRCCCKAFLFR